MPLHTVSEALSGKNAQNVTGMNKKRPYKKPRLRVIELVAEEVLAVGCKMAHGGKGPLSHGTCQQPSICYVPGS